MKNLLKLESRFLTLRGTLPPRLYLTAFSTFDKVGDRWKVTTMELMVRGNVPRLDQAEFEDAAIVGEASCPISNALRNNVEIRLNAKLE